MDSYGKVGDANSSTFDTPTPVAISGIATGL
jgi:hypothetical protein